MSSKRKSPSGPVAIIRRIVPATVPALDGGKVDILTFDMEEARVGDVVVANAGWDVASYDVVCVALQVNAPGKVTVLLLNISTATLEAVQPFNVALFRP